LLVGGAAVLNGWPLINMLPPFLLLPTRLFPSNISSAGTAVPEGGSSAQLIRASMRFDV
jgi:hypothetical protein